MIVQAPSIAPEDQIARNSLALNSFPSLCTDIRTFITQGLPPTQNQLKQYIATLADFKKQLSDTSSMSLLPTKNSDLHVAELQTSIIIRLEEITNSLEELQALTCKDGPIRELNSLIERVQQLTLVDTKDLPIHEKKIALVFEAVDTALSSTEKLYEALAAQGENGLDLTNYRQASRQDVLDIRKLLNKTTGDLQKILDAMNVDEHSLGN